VRVRPAARAGDVPSTRAQSPAFAAARRSRRWSAAFGNRTRSGKRSNMPSISRCTCFVSRRCSAPSCRFSSTVRRPRISRPSGTCTIPLRTRRDDDQCVMSCPSNVIRPDAARTSPLIVFRMVLLPAPFAPMSVTISPAGTAKTHAPDRLNMAVGDRQILNVQAVGSASSRPKYASITAGFWLMLSGVPSASISPKFNTVSSEQICMTNDMWCSTSKMVTPSCNTRRNQVLQVQHFRFVHPGGWLVQEQQRRACGKRPRDLQPPLIAVG